MKRIVLILLLYCVPVITRAQEKLYDISYPGQEGICSLNDIASYYVDSTDALSVEAISKLAPLDFKRMPPSDFPSFGTPAHIIWFVFQISNSSVETKDCNLTLNNRLCSEFTVWQQISDTIHLIATTGRVVPFANRPYASNYYVVPARIAGGSNLFYTRADSRGIPFRMGFKAITPNILKSIEVMIHFWVGLFAGIFILLFFFSGYLFFSSKERIYIYYMCYLICAFFLLLTLEGYDAIFLFPGSPNYTLALRLVASSLMEFFILQVMQQFVGQTRQNSIFYLPVTIVAYLSLGIPVLSIATIHYAQHYLLIAATFKMVNSLVVAGVILILCSCIEKIRQGNKVAIFYLTAIGLTMTSGLFFVLHINVLPLGLPPSLLVDIAISLETVIISFGILYRYNLYKSQKEKLEQHVLVLQKESADKIIQAEFEERKRIAQDLHDDVSGTLSGLRFYVTNQFNTTPAGSDKENRFRNQVLDIMTRLAKDIRNIAYNLMPEDFKDKSLIDVIKEKIAFLDEQDAIAFEFIYTGTDRPLSREQKLSLYRCINELLKNSMHHSGATQVVIQFFEYPQYIEIQVQDNGRGFDANSKQGLGITGIQSRIHLLNGTVTIDSSNFGTTIIIHIPI